jgi:alpha-L-fucosidase
VFVTAQNGYLWTTVKIGGTLESPTEDLSGRLAQAVGEQAIDTGVQLLNAAPEHATDAAKKAIDLLSPLIP